MSAAEINAEFPQYFTAEEVEDAQFREKMQFDDNPVTSIFCDNPNPKTRSTGVCTLPSFEGTPIFLESKVDYPTPDSKGQAAFEARAPALGLTIQQLDALELHVTSTYPLNKKVTNLLPIQHRFLFAC